MSNYEFLCKMPFVIVNEPIINKDGSGSFSVKIEDGDAWGEVTIRFNADGSVKEKENGNIY